MSTVNLTVIEGGRGADGGPLPQGFAGKHACEYCKCCSCKKACTMCRNNCTPAESYFIPVIGCPDFEDMRKFEPIRYLYRRSGGAEYRIRLPKSR
ncbi:MAG: hypothetical protein PVJ42_03705 [bacterium]|jgi:hypothetical protein